MKVTIVEPGGFRTDFAGSSMSLHAAGADYAPALAARFEMMRADTASKRGDPAKGAQAILKIVNEKAPPLRLLLGTDALYFARFIQERQRAEDEAWKQLSASTDFPGQPDAEVIYANFLG